MLYFCSDCGAPSSIRRKKPQCDNSVFHKNSNRSSDLWTPKVLYRWLARNPKCCELSTGGASASHENEPGSISLVPTMQWVIYPCPSLHWEPTALNHSTKAMLWSHHVQQEHIISSMEQKQLCHILPGDLNTPTQPLLLKQDNPILPNHQKNPWRFASSSVLARSQQLSGRTWSKIFCELSHLLSLLHVACEIYHNIPSPVGM